MDGGFIFWFFWFFRSFGLSPPFFSTFSAGWGGRMIFLDFWRNEEFGFLTIKLFYVCCCMYICVRTHKF